MTAKFTPGPWDADEGSGFIVAPTGHVAQMWNKFEENFDNHLANANLIAAAPEMYGVLRRLSSSACDGRDIPEWLREQLHDIHAALAKADGRR